MRIEKKCVIDASREEFDVAGLSEGLTQRQTVRLRVRDGLLERVDSVRAVESLGWKADNAPAAQALCIGGQGVSP